MGKIKDYFSNYKKTRTNFDKFHIEIINSPRDNFGGAGIKKIKSLSYYFLISEDRILNNPVSYKEILSIFKEKVDVLNEEENEYRDFDFEKEYLKFTDLDLFYKSISGRMFRHVMEIALLFGLISNSNTFVTEDDEDESENDEIANNSESKNSKKKIVNYNKCKEYFLSNDKNLMPIARNNLFMLNIKSNDFIKSVKGIKKYIDANANYRPAYCILKYLKNIKRQATGFELSVLFGRVDNLNTEEEILNRALDIATELPKIKVQQKEYIFNELEWKNEDGSLFVYKNSQSPDFKFHSFLLYMEDLNLIKLDENSGMYKLSQYSMELLNDEIDSTVADLDNLIESIDSDDSANKELNNLILYQRNPDLLELAKKDIRFIEKVNLRNLSHPRYDKTHKLVRSPLIAELAKIQAGYKCQYKNDYTFRMPDGKYYCEAHHIIQFNAENGPDVTDNLVVLGPEAHMCIHHACEEDVTNLYLQLAKNGVLNIERFEKMITTYNCINETHINILFNKKIITLDEKNKLLKELNECEEME